jgi:hypothetical protein
MENKKEIYIYKKENIKKRISKNNKGFLVLTLGLLMPILSIIIFSLTQLGVVYKYKTRAETLCRSYLIQSQIQTEKKIKQLLKLNPRAKILRSQRRQSQKILFKALQSKIPPAIALAKANDLRVLSLQLFHHSKQKLLISQIHLKSLKNRTKINRLLPKKLDYKLKIQSFKSPLVSFNKYPLYSPSPEYHRASFFSKKQYWQLHWQIQIKNLMPDWVSLNKKYKITDSCGATIQKKGLEWEASLKKMDKYI